MGPERREFPLAGALWRPIGPGGRGKPRLRAEPHGQGHHAAGARHRARRRYRQARLGIQVQRLPERRPATPRRVGVPRGRPRNRQPLRHGRRRDRHRAEQGRQAPVGPFGRRGVLRLHHARRPDDVPARRRGPGHRERRDFELGCRLAAPAPVHRARQADRPDRLDREPGRPPVRHELRRADDRDDQRHAAPHQRQRRRRGLRDEGADRREGLGLPRRQTRHQHRRRGLRQLGDRLARRRKPRRQRARHDCRDRRLPDRRHQDDEVGAEGDAVRLLLAGHRRQPRLPD